MNLGSSAKKESKQVLRGKKILYGIMGFVASAIIGAIYIIANLASGQDEMINVNNFTTTGIVHNKSNWIFFKGINFKRRKGKTVRLRYVIGYKNMLRNHEISWG